MERHHSNNRWMIYKWAIFRSYVKLPVPERLCCRVLSCASQLPRTIVRLEIIYPLDTIRYT
jgi:hypothetical protein